MKEKDIINTVESARPELSSDEQNRIWSVIETNLPRQQSIPSPYLFSSLIKHSMTPLIIALILVLGGGGTALASDASRPGDFLFPVDRAVENIRLSLAMSESRKENLTRTFTEERLKELREIIDEELVVSPSNADTRGESASSTATSTVGTLSIEADVFTDVTVVRLEINDTQFYFEADAVTREAVVLEITTRFPMLTSDDINAQLDFEIEDRASRPKDRGVVSLKETGEVRINRAVEAIISFLNETGLDDSDRNNILSTLSSEVDEVTKVRRHDDRLKFDSDDNRLEIRVDDNGDSRVELRNGTSRIRIEEKDGEVRIKTKDESHSDKDSEDRVRATLGSTTVGIRFDVEADVFTDTTIVKIEFDDEEFSFETDSDTRADVVSDINTRFPSLTIAQIDAELDFQIEDRASRPQDGGVKVDDDRDDDMDRDDENDEERDERDSDDDDEVDEERDGHGGDRDDDEDEREGEDD